MNAPVMNVAADIGRDGNTQIPNNIFSRVSRDAYGYGISYYENDFKAIGQNSPINLAEIVPNGMGTGKNLFNGNIRATTLQIKHLGDPVTYSYSYDQLNRLVKMRQHQTAYTAPAGSTAAALAIANPTSEYKENIRYDANGNIMDYLRNGTTANSNPLEMDDMRYEYYANTNKLRRVHDPIPSGNYGEDIDQQTNANNYKYDNIGNLISDAAENISSIRWNVSGKISRITKNDANNTVIEYEYDATGNRIYKKVTSAGQEKYTYYIKDAQGNSMALYSRTDAGVVEWGEQHLYGSSRLGVHRFDMPVPAGAPLPAAGATMEGMFEYGRSQYELSNHLGNVLATISDKKVGIELGTTGTVEYFEPDVATANDYYPFGMLMPERSYANGGQYRYGFNGQEQDNEIKGTGNQVEFRYRGYDTRLGRFFAVDPIAHRYPYWTPYQFAGNMPIKFVDQEGLQAGERAARAGLALASPEAYQMELKAHQAQLESMKNVNPMECLHFILDGLGFVPGLGEFADGTNAAIYTAKGDYLNAAFSTISLAPVAGDLAAKGFKYSLKAAGYEGKAFKSLNAAQKWLGNAMEYGFKSADVIANRSGLNKALGIVAGSKQAAHHLIPIDLIKSNKTVRKAIDQGFDFNGAVNGLALDASRHTGRHPESYMQGVNNMISAAQKSMPDASAKEIMENVSGQLKTMINSTDGKVNDLFKK
jgi:RHS repeat-associated protein